MSEKVPIIPPNTLSAENIFAKSVQSRPYAMQGLLKIIHKELTLCFVNIKIKVHLYKETMTDSRV